MSDMNCLQAQRIFWIGTRAQFKNNVPLLLEAIHNDSNLRCLRLRVAPRIDITTSRGQDRGITSNNQFHIACLMVAFKVLQALETGLKKRNKRVIGMHDLLKIGCDLSIKCIQLGDVPLLIGEFLVRFCVLVIRIRQFAGDAFPLRPKLETVWQFIVSVMNIDLRKRRVSARSRSEWRNLVVQSTMQHNRGDPRTTGESTGVLEFRTRAGESKPIVVSAGIFHKNSPLFGISSQKVLICIWMIQQGWHRGMHATRSTAQCKHARRGTLLWPIPCSTVFTMPNSPQSVGRSDKCLNVSFSSWQRCPSQQAPSNLGCLGCFLFRHPCCGRCLCRCC